MDIRPTNAALLVPRRFAPREQLPVPGNPNALSNRPDVSPGIIPVGEQTQRRERIAIDTRPDISPLLGSRRFSPRQQIPVPGGNPTAIQNRPERAPGVIPVPDSSEGDIIEEVERAKRASVDFKIIDTILGDGSESAGNIEEPTPGSSSDEVADTSLDTPPELVRATPEQQLERPVSEPAVSVSPESPRAAPEPDTAPQPVRRTDPLVLDLGGEGVNTNAVQQVRFDIDADGRLDTVNQLDENNAYLALDRNANGRIDNGAELFGDQHGATNGFEELRNFDDNGDGQINALDSIFTELRLFRASSNETQSLTDAGVRSIKLDYQNTDIALNTYDRIAQLSSYEREDGTSGEVADVLLGQQA